MRPVLVIGGGFAGLAAATSLAASGRPVTLVEAATTVGGKAQAVEAGGARVDVGPTLLVDLRPLRALADVAGVALDDVVTLHRLDPAIVATFPSGAPLRVHVDAGRLTAELRRQGPHACRDWERFLGLGARAARLAEHFTARGDIRGLGDFLGFVLGGRPSLGDVLPFARRATLARLLDQEIQTPALRQLLGHFARFVGLSADRAPAAVLAIPYLLATAGAWYPRGGVAALAERVRGIAVKLGVGVETGVRVERLEIEGKRVRAAVTATGRRVEADAVVAAVDAGVSAPWIGDRSIAALKPTSAERVAWWVVEGRPRLDAHQAFHFDEAGDPLYVAVPTLTDPDLAPPGTSVVYGLVHGAAGDPWAALVRRRLERAGHWPDGRVLAAGIAGAGPACYGYEIGPGLLASFRPAQRVPGVANLVRAGGSVFPGPGIANAIRSGLRAAALVGEACA